MKFPRAALALIIMELSTSQVSARKGRILLQTSSEVKTYYDWQARLPELSGMSKTDIWTVLGDNWWVMFIDGKGHAKGKHVFDKTSDSIGLQSGSKTSEKMYMAYESFKKPDAWGQRWTVEKLEALNMLFQGGEFGGYFENYVPRFYYCDRCGDIPPTSITYYCEQGLGTSTEHRCKGTSRVPAKELHEDEDHNMSSFLPLPCEAPCTDKRTALAALLDEYHNDIDALVASSTTSAESLISGVRRLAKLYYNLADLHPFRDGNSRVRHFVMQTQLVELGGHPSSMWDMYWQVYFEPDLDAVTAMLLQGWCAWEMTHRSGHSPFVVHGNNKSVPIQTYDPRLGICRKSPVPADWYGKPM